MSRKFVPQKGIRISEKFQEYIESIAPSDEPFITREETISILNKAGLTLEVQRPDHFGNILHKVLERGALIELPEQIQIRGDWLLKQIKGNEATFVSSWWSSQHNHNDDGLSTIWIRDIGLALNTYQVVQLTEKYMTMPPPSWVPPVPQLHPHRNQDTLRVLLSEAEGLMDEFVSSFKEEIERIRK